jgi:L-ascorbate metabolism protein UlaG (beta-lactamase superfamily)
MEDLQWLGHDGFKLKILGKTIYIDPFKSNVSEKADIILITHEHYDHCSVEDILRISTNETTIFITPDCQSKLSQFPGKVVIIEPNNTYDAGKISIKTVPAYNTNKMFHPKENDWVGFIIEADDERIYHAGDTDLIPEMKSFGPIDYALLPVSGTYVMDAKEAAQAAEIIKPKIAIPMHYDSIVGTTNDAEQFRELYKGNVKIMEKA